MAYRKVEVVTLEKRESDGGGKSDGALDWFASAPTSHDVAMLFHGWPRGSTIRGAGAIFLRAAGSRGRRRH